MKPHQLMFIFFLTFGTFIAVSAESWFTCWIGLEINLMSLIPLLLLNMSPVSTESAIKYFLAQAMASILIMFSSLSSNTLFTEMTLMNSSSIIFFALAIKAGTAPFHFWFPQVMQKSNWLQCAIIVSWQKLAPFILMASFTSLNAFITLAIFSSLTGCLGGLNQTNLKIILTYSSIIHSSWMILTIFFSVTLWFSYYMIYVFISLTIIYLFSVTNIYSTTQINYSSWNQPMKLSFSLLILSLGGLPPLLGFAAKIMSISILMFNISTFMIFFMVTTSLISLFYYLFLTYNLMMTLNFKHKMMALTKNPPSFMIFMAISILGNVITPAVIYLT